MRTDSPAGTFYSPQGAIEFRQWQFGIQANREIKEIIPFKADSFVFINGG